MKAALQVLTQIEDLDVASVTYEHAYSSNDRELHIRMRTRTGFFEACERLKLRPSELPPIGVGQRRWYAERDKFSDVGLLVEATSFKHHDDWEPRS